MLNSAFNDLETAYGADAVVHTFIGKAYSGTIRAHLLAHQAISSILLEFNCWNNLFRRNDSFCSLQIDRSLLIGVTVIEASHNLTKIYL